MKTTILDKLIHDTDDLRIEAAYIKNKIDDMIEVLEKILNIMEGK